MGQTGATANQYRYRGEQYESELDGYNLRYRYYRQGQGRFSTFDPIGGWLNDPASLHKFQYVAADPVNYIDSLGLATGAEYGLVQKENTKKVPLIQRLGQGIKCVVKELAEEIAEDAVFGLIGASGFGLGVAGDVGSGGQITSSRQRDRYKDKVRKDGQPYEKPGPKPNGEHRKKIDEILKRELDRGLEHLGGGPETEVTVDTKNGYKPYRRADLTFRDPVTGKIQHHNVGLSNVSGEPILREREALEDFRRHANNGNRNITLHSYGNRPRAKKPC